MAIQKHLRIFLQGVKVWNMWRRQFPKTRPDLSGLESPRSNLKGVDFHYVNLEDADLANADLTGANLDGAKVWNSCPMI